ncbi:beta-glucan synthesis-associated protein [Basidiobolus ranarum]|uniref:Beta-glucan synthesis-associated protein n=1 Tax=Basidiobolus ranarum TaxID=34480 RepID=A0ABR2VYY9_9FUNG
MSFLQTHRSIKLWVIVISAIGFICLVVITPIVRHEKNKNHRGDNYNEVAKVYSSTEEPNFHSRSEITSFKSTSTLATSSTVTTTPTTSATTQTTSSKTSTTATATPTPVSPWIDPDTPKQFTTKIAGGQNFTLVFSDEFEKAGRTFAEGNDPKWTAVDLWYWATGDMEWYSPNAVSTSDGSMKIRMTKEEINGHSYMSGMVQSWNKFCFTGGILEVNVSLPGSSEIPGFWPAIWTLGNLGRAGYGATTDGTWPYSYDTCDAAVSKYQSMPAGFSRQPGQRLNKCVCPGEDHPNPGVGRGAPEIDIFEVSINNHKVGVASLSDQVAPFDLDYTANGKYMHFYDTKAWRNGWPGGPLQQCVSGVAEVPPSGFEGKGFQN